MALDALPTDADKGTAVRTMFDKIAPRYDVMNRLMTLGLDQRWRVQALDAIGVGAQDRLVDLACGTGDLSELARARGARVFGMDFAREMLRGASKRSIDASFVQADVEALPVDDGAVTAITCGFALRNFVSLEAAFGEMARVLEPGGRLAILEVDRPHFALARLGHGIYFDRVVPKLGALLSDKQAYAYLPQSTAYLPEAAELRAMLEKAGFGHLRKRSFLLGSAQLLTGERIE
jgi:demethylmenaquinone methyltransferase/2-methoxy-6-polyprenyl-1,4-benzoquinol methylase